MSTNVNEVAGIEEGVAESNVANVVDEGATKETVKAILKIKIDDEEVAWVRNYAAAKRAQQDNLEQVITSVFKAHHEASAKLEADNMAWWEATGKKYKVDTSVESVAVQKEGDEYFIVETDAK